MATANFAPNLIYVHFWVGLVVAQRAPRRRLSRLQPLARGRPGGRLGGGRVAARPLEAAFVPGALGRWPAVLGILGFAWLELAYTKKDDPERPRLAERRLRGGPACRHGGVRDREVDRAGDAFSVYFNLFSRLSVFDAATAPSTPAAASGAPVLAGDPRKRRAALCRDRVDDLRRVLERARVGLDQPGHPAVLLASRRRCGGPGPMGRDRWPHRMRAGRLALLLCRRARDADSRRGTHRPELAGRFAHTLIPIAFAYALAHYFSLLIYQGQAMSYLISDPLGHGSNIFGTATSTINYNVISTKGIWYVQVGALIAGHVAGLILPTTARSRYVKYG